MMIKINMDLVVGLYSPGEHFLGAVVISSNSDNVNEEAIYFINSVKKVHPEIVIKYGRTVDKLYRKELIDRTCTDLTRVSNNLREAEGIIDGLTASTDLMVDISSWQISYMALDVNTIEFASMMNSYWNKINSELNDVVTLINDIVTFETYLWREGD